MLPWLGRRIKRFRVDEFELTFLLIVALGAAVLAEMLHMHFILGAFVVGAPAAVPDDRAFGAPAQRQRQGVDGDRFTGPGLARGHRQAAIKREFELMNNREIADVEVLQHRLKPSKFLAPMEFSAHDIIMITSGRV